MAYEGSPGKVSGETGIMEVVLFMEGTDWQEVNRKVTEFYNAMKECDFFFVQSGDETEYAEISQYGRLEKGYDTGQEWIEYV